VPATPVPTSVAQPTTAFPYVFPVQSDTIAYGRAHHDYPATDIFCPVGSIFVAPTNGVIDYVNREDLWDPKTDRPADRGGLSIALIGDDGVRYYGSHLSQINEEITPGLRVEVGQQLGRTGKSGNARFTPSHLHFGISHPTTPDDWRIRRGEISPYPYLKSWERGQPLTPPLP
jgi:murein DD-endopeptidase MepM/ murein hydrolase activator NlpD